MVGQQRLLSTLNKHLSAGTLPRTIMFEGEWGCGKHTITNYVAESLGFPLVDISDTLNLETIERIMLSPTPSVYLIDSCDISIKEQNVILKFLEEPLKNAYIILLTTNKSLLLNTVVNRCVCMTFEGYTQEELNTFITDASLWSESLLQYANTPGRVKLFEDSRAAEVETFVRKILLQVRAANYSNVLTIPSKVALKSGQEELYNFELFSYLLVNVACSLYSQQLVSFTTYEITNQFYNDTKIPHINKATLLESYLIRLRRAAERGA